MISLEQVKLLESRVARAVEYVERIKAENASLTSDRTRLQTKLDANQKRLDELEVLVMRFKEDQGRIEDGIIAALDRLSQFEEAFESSLKEKVSHRASGEAARAAAGGNSGEASRGTSGETHRGKKTHAKKQAEQSPATEEFFEISEKETEDSADELDIF